MHTRLSPRNRLAALLAAAVAIAALAAFAATVASGASQTHLKLRFSHTAKIGSSGSTVTIRGSVSCTARRYFALSLSAVEPATNASVHGSVPPPRRKAPLCKPPRKSFSLVATEQGELKPIKLKNGTLRACLFVRSWGKHVRVGLDATCVTLHASH